MIRLLVLILVAVNLLYLAWAHWGPDRPVLTASLPALQSAATATPPPPPPCATIGPFSDPLLVAQVQQQLELGGLGPQPREASEMLQDGWWVHVDNPDQEHQTQALEALRRAGLNDAFAMPEDPQFRVSVGIFTADDRAEDRAAQVRRLKLEAMVSAHLKEQAATWLDVPGIAQEALRSGRLAAAGVALDKLRIEACPPANAATNAPPAADIIPAP